MSKVQQIAPKDFMTSFGSVALATGTDFENKLNLNKADASRMQVKVVVSKDAVGGTSVVFKLQGSNDDSTYSDIAVTPSIAASALKKGANFAIGIPDGTEYKFMKVTAAKTGSFTDGVVEASIDAYFGM